MAEFPRVSTFDVGALLTAYRETNPPVDFELLPFITIGHQFVEEHLGGGKTALSEELLTSIELYASAHFAMATSSDLQARKITDSSEAFARSAPTMGITKYLKLAYQLDSSGLLAKAQDKKMIVQVLSL